MRRSFLKFIVGTEKLDVAMRIDMVALQSPRSGPRPLTAMNWIKRNYDQFILALVALLLLVLSGC